MVVIVLSADVLRPRLLAMADGASACSSVALVNCAAELAAEPVLMTLTSASTACTTTAGTMELAGTLRVAATTLVSTVGAARLPPLVALSSRVTMKETLACSKRATRSWRRVEDSTVQPGSPPQRSLWSADFICAAVTPVGRGVETADVCSIFTFT